MIFEFSAFYSGLRLDFINNVILEDEDQNMLNIIRIISLNKALIDRESIIII